jgi:hypothetical protein
MGQDILSGRSLTDRMFLRCHNYRVAGFWLLSIAADRYRTVVYTKRDMASMKFTIIS